jgi:tetratricopeptide (TPR) repeat protein
MDRMKLPIKLEKKTIAAGALLVLVAVGAFVVGASREKHADATPADKAEKSDAHTGHDEKSRAPASTPEQKNSHDSESDESDYEELDVQIAHPAAKVDHRGTFTKLVDTYVGAWESTNEKVRAIYRAEEDNRRLKLENAYLRVMVESQKFSCRADESKKKTETVGKKLATAAGSKAARSLASIRYQFPENLLPEQLHTLGVSYFKAKDDEKSAVIFNFLLGLEDDASFRTADTYLMAGISLYRLENYKSAEEYFEKVDKIEKAGEDTAKAKRQASYWKALVADRLRDGRRAQKIILENLEKNPHTKEARWVNPKGIGEKHPGKHETKRAPASKAAETHSSEEHHDKESPNENHGQKSHH